MCVAALRAPFAESCHFRTRMAAQSGDSGADIFQRRSHFSIAAWRQTDGRGGDAQRGHHATIRAEYRRSNTADAVRILLIIHGIPLLANAAEFLKESDAVTQSSRRERLQRATPENRLHLRFRPVCQQAFSERGRVHRAAHACMGRQPQDVRAFHHANVEHFFFFEDTQVYRLLKSMQDGGHERRGGGGKISARARGARKAAESGTERISAFRSALHIAQSLERKENPEHGALHQARARSEVRQPHILLPLKRLENPQRSLDHRDVVVCRHRTH